MPNPLPTIATALEEWPTIGQDVPTAVAVAPDVYPEIARRADALDPRMELSYAGVTRVHGLDVEIDERLPAGMIEVR